MEPIILALEIVTIILLLALFLRGNAKQGSQQMIELYRSEADRIRAHQTELSTQQLKEQQQLQVTLLQQNGENRQQLTELMQQAVENIRRTNEEKLSEIKQAITDSRLEQQRSLAEFSKTQQTEFQQVEKKLIQDSTENREVMQRTIRTSLEEIRTSNEEKLKELRESNETKLSEIQKNVNEKLDRSLNERLDESFKQIGERLESLYKSLGQLQQLESGVSSLNRTLTNVKTRGIFGEVQLGNILANVLERSQYEENVATKKNSQDRVEFAVKIPDKENKGGFIYLPIDSKFPADIYERIVQAADAADAAALKQASAELKQRIKTEAMTIRDKYIAPPATTDFAILFLPTEGLYSEVLRIPGLVEECQKQYKIIISGPTTVTALLNSLAVGFRYLTVNKNAQEILKTLSAVKAQYEKFGTLIEKTQKKLDEAQKAADEMKTRSDMIQRKLSKVETMEEGKAEAILQGSTEEEV